jgi:hypothetical protein
MRHSWKAGELEYAKSHSRSEHEPDCHLGDSTLETAPAETCSRQDRYSILSCLDTRTGCHWVIGGREATLLDYIYEVDHAVERIQRLDQAIDEAIRVAPPESERLSNLSRPCGIAQLAAVTLVAEIGSLALLQYGDLSC